MDKKNLIYIGVGVVVAYFLVSYMKKEKEKREAEEKLLIEEIAEKEKIDACNKSADEFMAGRGKTRDEDLEAIRKAKFEECLKSKGL
jgi:hypothetical protein